MNDWMKEEVSLKLWQNFHDRYLWTHIKLYTYFFVKKTPHRKIPLQIFLGQVIIVVNRSNTSLLSIFIPWELGGWPKLLIVFDMKFHEFLEYSTSIIIKSTMYCPQKPYLFLIILMFSFIEFHICCGKLTIKDDKSKRWQGAEGALWTVSTRYSFM